MPKEEKDKRKGVEPESIAAANGKGDGHVKTADGLEVQVVKVAQKSTTDAAGDRGEELVVSNVDMDGIVRNYSINEEGRKSLLTAGPSTSSSPPDSPGNMTSTLHQRLKKPSVTTKPQNDEGGGGQACIFCQQNLKLLHNLFIISPQILRTHQVQHGLAA